MKVTAQSLGAAAVLQPSVAWAAASTTDPAGNSALFSLIAPLLLIAGAIVVGGLLFKRWRGAFGGSAGPLHLVHVIALGPRERLALVKVGARYLVVGITPTTISRIAELDDVQDAATRSPAPSDAADGAGSDVSTTMGQPPLS
jgi:flagellar protein FliO/FliZ